MSEIQKLNDLIDGRLVKITRGELSIHEYSEQLRRIDIDLKQEDATQIWTVTQEAHRDRLRRTINNLSTKIDKWTRQNEEDLKRIDVYETLAQATKENNA